MLCKRAGELRKYDDLRFNNASIFHTMEQFIETVHKMENTVLFPSKLLDLTLDNLQSTPDLGDKCDSIIKTLTNIDLYHLYKSITQMKVDLVYSRNTNNFNRSMKSSESESKFKCARSYSSTSMQSVQSASTSSDSESDILTEIDSGMESEDQLSVACKVFKRHLHELNSNIQKLTSIAECIISIYQFSIENQT